MRKGLVRKSVIALQSRERRSIVVYVKRLDVLQCIAILSVVFATAFLSICLSARLARLSVHHTPVLRQNK